MNKIKCLLGIHCDYEREKLENKNEFVSIYKCKSCNKITKVKRRPKEKMRKRVYVAHPYLGKEENKEKVEQILKTLVRENPDVLYVSPIHAVGFLYTVMPYEEGMKHCFELLSLCDELLLCGEWEESTGCGLEMQYALSKAMPIKFYGSYIDAEFLP